MVWVAAGSCTVVKDPDIEVVMMEAGKVVVISEVIVVGASSIESDMIVDGGIVIVVKLPLIDVVYVEGGRVVVWSSAEDVSL